MVLFILLGLIVTIALAVVIVRVLPMKFVRLVSFILFGLAAFFSYLIYTSIMEPVHFNKEKNRRYIEIIERLKMIADTQDAHNTILGKFSSDKEGLIKFIDTARFAITDTYTKMVKVNKGVSWAPLIVEVEKKVVDTIGYESVKEKLFKNRDYKKMFDIPKMNAQFEIQTSIILRSNKITSSVFIVKLDKARILKGLSSSLISQEREALGGDEIPGPYLSIGSLNEVTVRGNWPPLYDVMSSSE